MKQLAALELGRFQNGAVELVAVGNLPLLNPRNHYFKFIDHKTY